MRSPAPFLAGESRHRSTDHAIREQREGYFWLPVRPNLAEYPTQVSTMTTAAHDDRDLRALRATGLGALPPADDRLFPRNTQGGVRLFWAKYWLWFFALLPWMILRQLFISGHQLLGTLWTWNREVSFYDGALRIAFMANPLSLLLTTVFGERFTAIAYRDTLIDPGPLFARKRLLRFLARHGGEVRTIVATHAHEEHVGNAALASENTDAPVYGTEVTLDAIRNPERLTLPRRVFIGQPEPAKSLDLRTLGRQLVTPAGALEVIESPGHCEGHASLFDPGRGVLFAGDSFLHTVFTSPNRDVSAADWAETLERYGEWDIRTMVGTHGYVYSRDPSLRRRLFITKRADPNEMILAKLAFLRWAMIVVAEGERRGLGYSVIEACLFPWQRWWAWQTWFRDESGRLFSGGEFSRTYFIRSLSSHPERVPPRFPPFVRVMMWLSRTFERRRSRSK